MISLALGMQFREDILVRGWKWLLTLAGITTALATSFKVELLSAIHNFINGQDAFKLALFRSGAAIVGTYDASTTNYSAMTGNGDEVANGGGYTTGGVALTNTTPSSTGTTAFTTPSAAAQWLASTFVTRGCMGYNTNKANRAWFVYDFGGDISIVAGNFTINMPANAAGTALTRL